jgi:hypothetical protein
MHSRLMLVAGTLLVVLVLFLIVASPSYMGGGPTTLELPTTWGAIAAAGIGLLWMIRILRSIDDAEAHRSFFRSCQ